MLITEKINNLVNTVDELDLEEKESNVLKEIIDILSSLAEEVETMKETASEQGEQLDAVDEDLADLESFVYNDEDDECEGPTMYEIECPSCGESIYLDDSVLEEGKIDCPSCGKTIDFSEFQLEFEDSDCDCDCNCKEK